MKSRRDAVALAIYKDRFGNSVPLEKSYFRDEMYKIADAAIEACDLATPVPEPANFDDWNRSVLPVSEVTQRVRGQGTAAFGDGYGNRVVISGDDYSHMVCIVSHNADGTRTGVLFLPHERDEVLSALTKAFDIAGEWPTKRKAGA